MCVCMCVCVSESLERPELKTLGRLTEKEKFFLIVERTSNSQ